MPVTRTDICNYALSLIGEQLATDITNEDEGQHAVYANQLYDQVKREVLRSHKWKCARKRAELAENAEAPAFGYTNSFALPEDFIRLVSVNDVEPDVVKRPIAERVGSNLFTDEDTVSLDYVSEASDDALDPLLVEAIYTKLASQLAWTIQQNRTLREQLLQDYERVMVKARHADSMDSRAPLPSLRSQSNWIPARYTSTNG